MFFQSQDPDISIERLPDNDNPLRMKNPSVISVLDCYGVSVENII